MSEPLLPEDIGRTAMITKVAVAVRAAMAQAGITDPADVHYVQTKTPLLTIHTIRDAKSRGQSVWTENTGESMDVSNGTAALGIAVALGEIAMPADATSCATARCAPRWPRARPASSSTGRRSSWPGTCAASAAGTASATRSCGTRWTPTASGQRSGTPGSTCRTGRIPRDLDGRLVNVFLKCEASQDGRVRGWRNAMLDDSDVHWHRQIKACVGGVAAAVTGDPAVFVSVSAAHQGPDGGGPVAAIVDLGGRPA